MKVYTWVFIHQCVMKIVRTRCHILYEGSFAEQSLQHEWIWLWYFCASQSYSLKGWVIKSYVKLYEGISGCCNVLVSDKHPKADLRSQGSLVYKCSWNNTALLSDKPAVMEIFFALLCNVCCGKCVICGKCIQVHKLHLCNHEVRRH